MSFENAVLGVALALAIGFCIGGGVGSANVKSNTSSNFCAHHNGVVQGAVCVADGAVVAWPKWFKGSSK